MAAAVTYTASAYNNTTIRTYEKGVTHVGPFKAQWTAAGSVTDVLFLARVPHGATIVSFEEYHSNGETAAVIDFGLSKGVAAGGAGNASCLISGGALATMNRMSFAAAPAGWYGHVSLSDTDPIRYANLIGKAISGTFTITVSVTYALAYRMDETG